MIPHTSQLFCHLLGPARTHYPLPVPCHVILHGLRRAQPVLKHSRPLCWGGNLEIPLRRYESSPHMIFNEEGVLSLDTALNQPDLLTTRWKKKLGFRSGFYIEYDEQS